MEEDMREYLVTGVNNIIAIKKFYQKTDFGLVRIWW